jgi:hypothetical protein
LVDWGYRHFSPEPVVIEVKDAQVKELKEKAQEKEESLNEWKT